MIIKEIPEDFFVRELSDLSYADGDYAYFLLRKREWTTQDAVAKISQWSQLPLKFFGYAGLKDKLAVTEQHLSVYKGDSSLASFSTSGIELTYLGRGKERISLGDLKGNFFRIVVRDLPQRRTLSLRPIKNYFDTQRFGINGVNASVGRALVRRDFQQACELLQLTPSGRDYIGALRHLGTKKVLFFIHAYQSHLFNHFLDQYTGRAQTIPLVGYLTEFSSASVRSLYSQILRQEHVVLSDFLFREFPEISSEGSFRSHYVAVADFSYVYEKDERHSNAFKCILTFTLNPGAYGTFVVRSLFAKSL